MASISPLNEFKTLTHDLTTNSEVVYTTDIAINTIILHGQIANTTNDQFVKITAIHTRGAKDTYIVRDFEIPPNDVLIFIEGKVVFEEEDSLKIFADKDNCAELVLSYLETSA